MGVMSLKDRTRQAVRGRHWVSAFLHVHHNPQNVTAQETSPLCTNLLLLIVIHLHLGVKATVTFFSLGLNYTVIIISYICLEVH